MFDFVFGIIILGPAVSSSLMQCVIDILLLLFSTTAELLTFHEVGTQASNLTRKKNFFTETIPSYVL